MRLPRPQLRPGKHHPIGLAPHADEVTVRVGDRMIARSNDAIELHEAGHPVVLYIPLADVDRSVLRDSDRHSFCPYKGEASYYDVAIEGRELPAAVWYYPKPYDAVAAIAGRVAFYPDRVDISG